MSKTGYTVVLARDIDELHINPYNVEWLRAWDGNMDIQPVLDFFAVITYVTDYYSKDDTGMMEIMKKIMDQSEKRDLQERMRQVANIFLTHRQMGEAEAVYRLIHSMTLSMSNVTCQFVQTGPKADRSIMWKRATEEQLQAGLKAIKLDKKEGLTPIERSMDLKDLGNICYFFIFYCMKNTEYYFDSFDILYFPH